MAKKDLERGDETFDEAFLTLRGDLGFGKSGSGVDKGDKPSRCGDLLLLVLFGSRLFEVEFVIED
jgi:hypothetical protein